MDVAELPWLLSAIVCCCCHYCIALWDIYAGVVSKVAFCNISLDIVCN